MKLKKLLFLIFFLQACVIDMANAQSSQVINVGIMLPLHNINGDGRRMTEYYRGFLMAVEKLKSEGHSVNVHAWNVPEDADIRTTLLQDGANKCNIIFGPLYTKQVKDLGNFCRAYNIKMVIPFSINGNEVDENPMIYQVYQSPDQFNQATIEQITNHFANCHPVFIDCNDSTSNKGSFTMALRSVMQQKGVQYNITSLRSADDVFARSFSLSQPNIVILNTGRSPELTAALNKLDVLTANNQGVQIALFGYTEWLLYTQMNKERFAKYDTFIPSHFYYNPVSTSTQEFEQKYRWRFHQDLMTAQPRFALTGYDHAMYFLASNRQWVQTPLNFVKTPKGGYRNKAYMLIHYKTNGGIDALTY